MNLLLRKAGPDDAALVAELNAVLHQPHVDAQPERYRPLAADDPALIALHTERLNDPNMYTYIAEWDGAPVGCIQCIFSTVPDNVFVYGGRDLRVDQLVVRDSHQRRGIGEALMAQAADLARALDADSISLGVASFNVQAIAFYEKLGYRVRAHSMWKRL